MIPETLCPSGSMKKLEMHEEKVEVIILQIQCDTCLHMYDEVHPPTTQPRQPVNQSDPLLCVWQLLTRMLPSSRAEVMF